MTRDVLATSFGRVAADYDRVRPSYVTPALDRAVEALGLSGDADVLDLAAGTGTLTRALLGRFFNIVAVEPDARMRTLLPAVEALDGRAESIPLPDSSVDAVFVGDAFHWFDARAALVEIARVLRPRGGLALLWNTWWETEPPLPQVALDLLREPFVRSGRAAAADEEPSWRAAFDRTPFEPVREEAFPGELTLGPDDLVALVATTSSIAALDDREREELVASLRALLAGTYSLPLVAELVWTRLA
jgi:SAM-dependent methyltransferase